jgi:hypothetical protein
MEQCVICFQEFAKQEIGIPEHCQHSFCFTCLIDWSKVREDIVDLLIKDYIFRRKIVHVQMIVKHSSLF